MTESTASKPARRRAAAGSDDIGRYADAAVDEPAAEQDSPAVTGSAEAATAEVATYELARDELAAVVHTLESGGLGLDESLTLWERGEHLAAVCSRFLDNARERVESALARAERE